MLAFAPAEVPFEKLNLLGIAVRGIRYPSTPYQSHMGILYREKDESPVTLLHFEAHEVLKNEPPSEKFLWLQCAIDDINKKVVASCCAQIYKRAQLNKIPYGISYDGSYFDKAAEYTRYRPEDGLTCATFVMAVFRW